MDSCCTYGNYARCGWNRCCCSSGRGAATRWGYCIVKGRSGIGTFNNTKHPRRSRLRKKYKHWLTCEQTNYLPFGLRNAFGGERSSTRSFYKGTVSSRRLDYRCYSCLLAFLIRTGLLDDLVYLLYRTHCRHELKGLPVIKIYNHYEFFCFACDLIIRRSTQRHFLCRR